MIEYIYEIIAPDDRTIGSYNTEEGAKQAIEDNLELLQDNICPFDATGVKECLYISKTRLNKLYLKRKESTNEDAV